MNIHAIEIPLQAEKPKEILFYDVERLYCARCRDICDHCAITPDPFNTGDSPTAIECTGSLNVCPLNEEVQEKIRGYRHDSAMTTEYLMENMDKYVETLTEAMNNRQAATVVQIHDMAREEYFARIAIHEVKGE